MDSLLLTDNDRRTILKARLQGLEREHYEHQLNLRIGERIAGRESGAAHEEAGQMIDEASRAISFIEATHELLVAELAGLDQAEVSETSD